MYIVDFFDCRLFLDHLRIAHGITVFEFQRIQTEDTRMAESKRYTDDELFHYDVSYKHSAATADSDSDIEDFEMLSSTELQTRSGDEDTVCCGHMMDDVRTKQSSESSQVVPFSSELRKPPTLLTAPTPAKPDDVFRQAFDSSRVQRSALSNTLFSLAGDIDKLMVGETEKFVVRYIIVS